MARRAPTVIAGALGAWIAAAAATAGAAPAGERAAPAAPAAPATPAAPAAASQPPAAPAIITGSHTFAALAGRPAAVRIAWAPAPGVARYRARWIQDGTATDAELPGVTTAFERAVPQAGHYQFAVIAIDIAGHESPAAEVGIDVIEIAAIAPGADEPAPAPPSAPVFAVGARFRSPGLPCRLGKGAAAAEVTALEPGTALLRCEGDPGPRAEVQVVIAPVIASGPSRPLARGAATKVQLVVASVAPLGARLDVTAEGAEFANTQRTARGLEVTVTPGGSSATATLVVQSRGVPLARVELAVADPNAVPAPQQQQQPATEAPAAGSWLALDLGYHLGALVAASGSPALGDANRELGSTAIGGGRIGLFPTRRVGLEAELAIAPPDLREGHARWLVSARAHVAGRVFDAGRLGVRILGGAGVLDTTGAVHYGGALTFATGRNLWLRFQALHAITVAADAGYAHCVELQIGVMTRLGRRDHR